MVIGQVCRFPLWPMGPIVGGEVLTVLVGIAGAIFSLIMLIDCLKKPRAKFRNLLTKDGQYDKLIWAAGIVVSLWFYFLGAIVYYFVVKRAKPEKEKKE